MLFRLSMGSCSPSPFSSSSTSASPVLGGSSASPLLSPRPRIAATPSLMPLRTRLHTPVRRRVSCVKCAIKRLSFAFVAAAPPSLSCFSLMMDMSELSRRAEKPMLIAVSILSPVSTQSFTPASARSAMQEGTPSCSLSSMAVAPTTRSFCSTCAAASACRSSLLVTETLASCHSFAHLSYSEEVISRFANTSVRRPSAAKTSRCFRSSSSV
mmetsp:Transcript_431/g.1598  ORF Transcript_431/g.1598 Transcript_431/m.1598 type:complete len:212 (+) Transcript_431:1466-2101(+)